MATETNSRAYRFIIRKTRWDVPYAWQGYVSFCSWFVYPQQPDGRYYIRGIIQFKNPHRLSTLSRRYDSTAEWYPTRLGHESMQNEYILADPRPGIEKYQYGTYYRYGVNIPMPNKHLPVVGLHGPPPLTLSQQFIAPRQTMDSLGDDSFWWDAYDELDRAHTARPTARAAPYAAPGAQAGWNKPDFDDLYKSIDDNVYFQMAAIAIRSNQRYHDYLADKTRRKDPTLPRAKYNFDWNPPPIRPNKRKVDEEDDPPVHLPNRIKFSRI